MDHAPLALTPTLSQRERELSSLFWLFFRVLREPLASFASGFRVFGL